MEGRSKVRTMWLYRGKRKPRVWWMLYPNLEVGSWGREEKRREGKRREEKGRRGEGGESEGAHFVAL